MSLMNLRSLFAFVVLSCLVPVSVWAGSFTVSPVRLELSPQRPVSSLTITNDANEPVSIDARGMSWTQQNGADEHEETRELIVTPPVFTLAPGASQIVRIGLRRAPDANNEIAYRVFMTENPVVPRSTANGVAMNLRLSVPIFVRPRAAAQPKLEWTGTRTPEGHLKLRADNRGNIHVQVANLSLSAAGSLVGRQTSPAYLLPGQFCEWTVKPEEGRTFDVSALVVTGYSDAGDVNAEFTVR